MKRDDARERYKEEALRRLEGFVFAPLTPDDQAGTLDAWRCQKPGTSSYAFDILITRFGISVQGDIQNISFRVGLSYGMPFLAGDDVAYYIHSKLEYGCDRKELDEDALKLGVARILARKLVRAHDDLPDWIQEDMPDDLLRKLSTWTTKRPALRDLALETRETFIRLESVSTAEEAYNLLSELEPDPEGWPQVEQTSTVLLANLYMINEAARRILAQAPGRYKKEEAS